MQTFLPYKSFHKTASCLDYKRLGCQRKEAKQMIDIITSAKTYKTKWIENHPCTQMWKKHIHALKYYFNVISEEWVSRGYQHNLGFYELPDQFDLPRFLGNEDFHSRHRAALLDKNFEYYKYFEWSEEPKQDYIWPEG